MGYSDSSFWAMVYSKKAVNELTVENQRLRNENEQLKKELEILKRKLSEREKSTKEASEEKDQ